MINSAFTSPLIEVSSDTRVNTTYSPGEIEWKVDLSKGKTGYIGTPAVADLDGDGFVETLLVGNSYDKNWYEPEINFTSELFCLDHQGNTRWKFLLSNFWFSGQSSPIVCDLEGDGELEILIGGETRFFPETEGVLYCLDKDANINWQVNYTASWSNYVPAVADVNNDNYLEIVYSTWNEVVCLSHEGDVLWTINGGFLASFGYTPTIADLYNDGRMQVLVESWQGVYCFQGDPSDGIDDGVRDSDHFDDVDGGGDLLWHKNLQSELFGRWWMDSNAVADLAGDGRKEILTAGGENSLICLNSDGRTVWESEITGLESAPVIGDVDGDGEEDILIMANDWNWWDDWDIDDGIIDEDGDGKEDTRANTSDGEDRPDDKEPEPEPVDPEPRPKKSSFNMYCLDGRTGKTKWYYPLDWWGQVITLGDVDGDQDLEVFLSSEENIIAIDGDENLNDEIDDDEVLWEFRSGSIRGWANSFILADVDHDGQLELLVTASEVIYCLSVGGKCPKGTIEWGKVYFDLQNSNHYVSGIQSGVKIYPESSTLGQKQTMIKYGEPGEVVSFNMLVKNIGTYDAYYGHSPGVEFQDTFKFKAVNLPPGWWATFDVEEMKLAPQQVKELKMEVQIPYSAFSKSSANIQVLAFAKSSPWVNDTQETVTIVKGLYNLKLSCADTVKGDSVPSTDEPLTPGDTTMFRITVTNLGSKNDTAVISLDGPAGWELDTNLPTPKGIPAVNLGSGESRDFFVFADIPGDASSGEYPINLSAVSQGDPEISDEMGLTVKVNSFSQSIYVLCNESIQYVKPGAMVSYEVRLLNLRDVTVDATLQISWSLDTFNVSQNLTSLSVGPGQEGTYNVSVIAPMDALADVLCSITLTAFDSSDPRIFDTLTLWTIVEHVYDLSFSISANEVSIMPEAEFSIFLNTTNLGNGYDHYILLIENVSGVWGRELSSPPVTLDPRVVKSQSIQMNITVPRKTVTGYYMIQLTAISEGGKTIPKTIRVHVQEYMDVSGEITPIKRFGGPGKELEFTLNVTNLGNGYQTYGLLVLNMQLFEITYDDYVYLSPFGTVTTEITVEIPRTVYLETYNFTMGMSSIVDEDVWNTTFFLVEVTSPDLTLGDAKVEGDVNDGEVVSIKTTIENIGNAPAKNVTVSIYKKGGDEALATQNFDVVHTSQEVYLQWIVDGSDTEFVIRADPEDRVTEINENNNFKEFSYKNQYKMETSTSFIELLMVGVLLSAGLLLALGLFTLYKRRKEL